MRNWARFYERYKYEKDIVAKSSEVHDLAGDKISLKFTNYTGSIDSMMGKKTDLRVILVWIVAPTYKSCNLSVL